MCEVGDFGSRDKAIELRGDGGRLVVAVDGHRLTLLEDFSEAFGERFGCFSNYLPREHITNGVLYHLAFFVSIIAGKLREILKAQTYGNLIASCSSYEPQFGLRNS